MVNKINLLPTLTKVPAANGNPRSRVLDNPPPKDIDHPATVNNFAWILKGEKGGASLRQFKALLKTTF